MEDSEDATRAWMKFVEQAWPSPIDGGAPGTAPLTTNSRERIPWAIRNHRTIAGKTVMEVKEEAATICDAAVSFLARNTLARHESAAKERANHDRFGPLLNLPVGDFVEYVQREIIMKGHTDDYPVLEDFTQPKWKRYWETANLFHEDVIRWLLRPEVQLASLGRGSKMVNIYPYDSIIGPDGSKVRAVDDFATQVGVAAVNATRLMLNDPLRILGLMVQMQLAYQPAVVEACQLTVDAYYRIWFDIVPWRHSHFDEEGLRAASHLVTGIAKLVDGYVMNNVLYMHAKPVNNPIRGTTNEYPPQIFMPAFMMAVGLEAILNN